MANLPLILSLADDLDRLSVAASPFYFDPTSYYQCAPYLAALAPRRHHHQQQQMQLHGRDQGQIGGAHASVGKDGFQVCMDVGQFKPSELNVKVVEDSVVVEGKHEEREDDHGFITRHFVRRYALPRGYDATKVVSTLSSDGVLTVSVPKPAIEEAKGNERIVQIQQVGPAHLNVKENAKEDAKEDKA